MVAIPQPPGQDPTLEAMRKAMEAEELKEKPRTYLGASSIGDSCSRKLYYQLHGFPSKPIESQGLMAIQDGHRTEELTAARLRMVPGIELWTVDENGQQFGFCERVELLKPIDIIDPRTGEVTGQQTHGEFKGHIDGIIKGLIQAPKSVSVWENKTINQKKFDLFRKLKEEHGEKKVLKKWDYTYWSQAQIYMHYFDLTRHYTTVETPGGRDIESCRTEYDKVAALALIEKAKRIIRATEPPARIGPATWFECKFCRFCEVCHGAK